jgi:type IV pilus assembly protein PilC
MAKTFEYTVLTPGGTRTGKIDGPDQQAVAKHLRETGMTPIDIHEVSATGLNREISLGGNRAKPKDVAVVIRQLSTMVNAGLSLLNALNAIVEQTESPGLHKVLREVANDVETGSTLADALRKHPKIFSPVILAMVRAGETGGYLDAVLDSVADQLENELKLRRAIIGAMVYPAVVLVFAAVVVVVMLLAIVPVFQGIFEDLGKDLPLPTQILVWMSQFLKIAIGPLIAGGIFFGWWWSNHRNDLAVREKIDPLKLRMPLIGGLMQKVALARLSRSIATMSRVGVPIVQTLEITAETAGNVVISRAVERVRESVTTGRSLGKSIAAEPIFGPMISRMISVGEDAGALDEMLEKVAEFYDDDVAAATASITSIIEPLLIVGVGSVVGGILISLYLPIFQLSTDVEE